MSFRKRKDGYWVVDFRDQLGRKRSRSFGKSEEGRIAARSFDLEIKLKKSRGENLPARSDDTIYLDELCQLWVNEKKALGRKIGWLRSWVNIFNTKFAPSLTVRPCSHLTQADFIRVISEHNGSSSQATRNRYLGYLKSILQFGKDQGYLSDNVLHTWKKGKESRRNSLLTIDGLRAIQDYSPEHLAWAIDVAWNVPVRPGDNDLFSLRYDTHVDYSRSEIKVFHTKVGKWATIHCSDSFIERVARSESNSVSGYLIEYKGKKISNVRKALLRAAGPNGADLAYQVCMYDIRHLWITTMLNQGIEPSTIAYLAGTSVRMILKNYYEPHSADREKASLLLPQL